MGFSLRPYQHRAVEEVERLWAQGLRSVLLVAPTGAGKTVIAAEMIHRAEARHERVLFLAPRRELIAQAAEKLDHVGVNFGVLLAGAGGQSLTSRVQVASIDTMISRVLTRKKLSFEFDVILIDEAHIGVTSDARKRLLALWPAARIVGLTATPTRSDGKAMGCLYDELVEVTTPAELVHEGFLVPARYFSVSKPDLSRVRTTAGDYNARDLDETMNKPRLVGDIVQHWLEHANDRRTVVFATSIGHSVALAQEFIQSGVAAEHVSAETPQAERDAIIKRFRNGTTQVLTNAVLASIGFDVPDVSCVVIARPTKSVGLYLQMLGRGLRPSRGKADCLVLDHAGVVVRHGFATDERFWTLHGQYAQDLTKVQRAKAEREKKEEKDLECPQCQYMWRGGITCPNCNFTFPPKAKPFTVAQGKLIELNASPTKTQWTPDKKKQFYMELYAYALMRNWKLGAAAHKYKSRFGDWPEWGWHGEAEKTMGAEPSLETIRWIKSQQIAFSKARAR
jgi:superfamily II DNA or RNA helicase